MELVSVIIPIYNGEKYLNECLESIIKQKYREIEVILINDGSKDSTDRICREYCEKYENFKLICTTNMGVSHARNIGIDNSHRKVYLFYGL